MSFLSVIIILTDSTSCIINSLIFRKNISEYGRIEFRDSNTHTINKSVGSLIALVNFHASYTPMQ